MEAGANAQLLPPETLKSLREIFEAFDYDQDGLLEVDEVFTLMQMLGAAMSKSEVLDLVTEVLCLLHVCRPAAVARQDLRYSCCCGCGPHTVTGTSTADVTVVVTAISSRSRVAMPVTQPIATAPTSSRDVISSLLSSIRP